MKVIGFDIRKINKILLRESQKQITHIKHHHPNIKNLKYKTSYYFEHNYHLPKKEVNLVIYFLESVKKYKLDVKSGKHFFNIEFYLTDSDTFINEKAKILHINIEMNRK